MFFCCFFMIKFSTRGIKYNETFFPKKDSRQYNSRNGRSRRIGKLLYVPPGAAKEQHLILPKRAKEAEDGYV